MARMEGPAIRNVLLRREQYRRADNLENSAVIARAVVIAKIANCRAVCLEQYVLTPKVEGVSELKQQLII